MNNLHEFLRACAVCAIAGLLASAGPAAAQDPDGQLERDLTVAQKPIYEFGQHQVPRHIEIDAWVDKPNLIYAVGQPLRVMVRPHEDAYITVVDVGSSGRVALLYPNHFQQAARVRTGSTVAIPANSAHWEIKVGGPAGIDLIQVIASRRPVTLVELTQLGRTSEASPTVTLGRSAEDVARDLIPQLKPPPASSRLPAGFGVRNVLVRIVDHAALAPGAIVVLPANSGPSGQALPVAIAPLSPSPFGLTVRPDRPVYRFGETVRMIVSSQSDCRLTLIEVGTSGNAVQLFPNSFQRENLIRANQVVAIPASQSPFQLVARGPAGVEGVIAICRADDAGPYPLQPAQNGFSAVGTLQSIGRDLLVTGTPGESAAKIERASTSYLVVE